jgi:hypothetical protein
MDENEINGLGPLEAARMAVDMAAIIAEAWSDHYPEEVFPPPPDARTLPEESQSLAARYAAWAMRHASMMIAAQIRDDILESDDADGCEFPEVA